jgi:cation transport ATPase
MNQSTVETSYSLGNYSVHTYCHHRNDIHGNDNFKNIFYSLEKHSEHPLADAVASYSGDAKIYPGYCK